MQLPPVTASSGGHMTYAIHFLAAADAWGDAEIITAEQQAVIGEVTALVQTHTDALRARASATEAAANEQGRARARLGVRDVVLDLRVMAAGDGVLNGPAQRNRQSEIYRDVFLGGTAGDVAEAPVREEPELAARVHQRLSETPDFPARAALLADLGEAVTRSTGARDALDLAEDAENKAGDAEIAARLALRRALEQAYGKLRGAFPGQRDLVESFFPKQKGAAAKAKARAKAKVQGKTKARAAEQQAG